MNPATGLLIAQQLLTYLPQAIASYNVLRAELKDATLPPAEELLAKADAINNAGIADADVEINKYKKP